MNKMNLMVGIAALTSVSAIADAAPAPEKNRKNNKLPNILCITCEDISSRVGCFGDPVAVTPNLDRFSETAIRYTNMFTTVGVSSPSRSALITGMYPTAIGTNYMRNTKPLVPEGIECYDAVLPTGIKAYTEYMRAAGYYCTNNDKTDYQFKENDAMWDDCSKTAHWKNRPKGMPFFSIFNLFVTHESQTWVRQNAKLAVNPEDVIVPPYFPDDPVIRKDMAVVYSNIAQMDRQFQKLVDELDEAGLRDNTIIIWYSDNGGPLPREKRAIYESGMKVPFMISFPDGYRAGEIEESMQMFPDIPATILSLAGICPPDYMQGRAFLGKYKSEEKHEYVYGARNRMDEQIDKQGVVRDSRFRYIRNYNPEVPCYRPTKYRLSMPMMQRMLELLQRDSLDKAQMRWFVAPRPEEEFYVLADDPYEIHNQIGNPEYAEDIARLRKELDRWIDEECPRWKQTELESRAFMLPDGVQPSLEDPVLSITRQGVVIASENEGASYVYQINGKGWGGNPDHWILYTGPVKVKKGDVITAKACRAGMVDSAVVGLDR